MKSIYILVITALLVLTDDHLDAAAPKPNIVVILADDLGYGDVQCYNPGGAKIKTPHIDKLAAQGMRFTDGHTSSGVCSPTRYALLTGRYHWRTRLQAGIVPHYGTPLIAKNRMTIGSLAQQHGFKTAADANGKLAPASASAAMGREEQLSYNRRFVMKDGSYSWIGPRMSPNILRPAGPIDPDVGVWKLTSTGRPARPLATYVNFAMHPTVIAGNKWSPDYPGYLAKRLAEYFGPEMLTFFANGCCGNVNQVNVHWAAAQSGEADGERVATILGAAVFRALPELEPQKTFPPRVRSKMVTLQRRSFTDEEIADARRVALRISSREHDIFKP